MLPGCPRDFLYYAIRLLAGHCDGARSLDGAGFNKHDADYGHQLAARAPSLWDQSTRRMAFRTVRKYHKQLAKGGIDIDQVTPRMPLLARPPIDNVYHIRVTRESGAFRAVVVNPWMNHQLVFGDGPTHDLAAQALGERMRQLGCPGGVFRPAQHPDRRGQRPAASIVPGRW